MMFQVVFSACSLLPVVWAVDTSALIQTNAVRFGLRPDGADNVQIEDLFGGNEVAITQFMEAMNTAREATRLAGKELNHEGSLVDSGGGSEHRVMYGLFTTSVLAYRKRLEAVMSTWGAGPKSKGLLYSVAGRTYPSEWQEPGIVVGAKDCNDGITGNSCKEASLIAEAARRNVSWLVITGEDNYVDTARVEEVLHNLDPTVPVAMGCPGCGVGISSYGELVAKSGGLCGGCGEVLSRGALQMLAAHGRSALVKEYGLETQCDMSTSRALRKRGVPLKSFPGELSGNPIFSRKKMEQETGVLIFHYVMPATMQWLHVLRTGSAQDQSDVLPSLEAAAFKKGCTRGFGNNQWFRPKVKECRKKFVS